MCLKEIGLHAQNITTILVSIVNIKAGGGVGLCDHLMSTKIFTLIIRCLYELQKLQEATASIQMY